MIKRNTKLAVRIKCVKFSPDGTQFASALLQKAGDLLQMVCFHGVTKVLKIKDTYGLKIRNILKNVES